MNPWSFIAGAIVGGITAVYSAWTQNKSAKKEMQLAEKQYELQKQQYEEESQARAKANQEEADIEGLLEANTASANSDTFLSTRNGVQPLKNPLQKQAQLLGGI